MNTIHAGVVTLIRSAVTGEKLPLPEGFDLARADELIRKQSLLPMAFQGAYNCGIPLDSELMQQYQTKYVRCMVRSERQMRAAEKIYRAFEENGIDYMPLKGANIKKLYPQPELRLMGDADILIRLEQYERIRQVMEGLGYKEGDESYHELNWKSGELHVELHKSLFSPVRKSFYQYFGSGWDKAVKQDGCRYGLSDEDTFVYIFTHMAKHYHGSGVGGRHIVDLCVYLRTHPDMNEEKIERALEQLYLLDFYKNIRKLLRVWFEDVPADEKTEFISQYILSGGSWGDEETRFLTKQIRNSGGASQTKNVGIQLFWRAVFPPLEAMRYEYPILFKHGWLYPLLWPHRWIKGLLCRPKAILRKFSVLRGISDDKVQERKRALEYVGLGENI